MKRWLALIPLALFAVLVVVAWQQLTGKDPSPASFTSPERPVPRTEVTTLDGQPFSLPSLKGRPYLVNVWASWCTPCRAEHPFLVEMSKQNVEIVGVLYEDPNIPAAKGILEREGNPFSMIALDPQGDLGLDVGISGVPETFLVNADGMIIKTMRSPILDANTAKSFVDAYRAEVAKAPAQPGSSS
ncbi:MAG TPA: DsbE family thiol:disulfide interchange protein [Hyphomonadaceae bacterium]|nr:DsbE family thiol:disulfide interchange protein [Hyphomonadaceae bacterium]